MKPPFLLFWTTNANQVPWTIANWFCSGATFAGAFVSPLTSSKNSICELSRHVPPLISVPPTPDTWPLLFTRSLGHHATVLSMWSTLYLLHKFFPYTTKIIQRQRTASKFEPLWTISELLVGLFPLKSIVCHACSEPPSVAAGPGKCGTSMAKPSNKRGKPLWHRCGRSLAS